MTTFGPVESSHTYQQGLIPIGEVAKRCGVTVGTVRRWDKAGRIQSVRTPNGHRRFRSTDVDDLLAGVA